MQVPFLGMGKVEKAGLGGCGTEVDMQESSWREEAGRKGPTRDKHWASPSVTKWKWKSGQLASNTMVPRQAEIDGC